MRNIVAILVYLVICVILGFVAEDFLVLDSPTDLDSSTRIYVYFQIFVFWIVLIRLEIIKGWHAHTNTTASILTFLGVLGTFIGIYNGLQEFKSVELQNSIDVLLDSLKLAFGTSIVGIVTAILLKAVISPIRQKIQKGSGADLEQKAAYKPFADALKEPLADALKEALESTETHQEHPLAERLRELTTAFKNENETTKGVLKELIENLTEAQNTVSQKLNTLTSTVGTKNDLIIDTEKIEATKTRKTLTDMQSELTDKQNKSFIQLKTLTKTVSYEHNQLRKEFETFSKNVAESITELATKELISSLTKVIEQFNTELSTQFGDNFKQLNKAVGKTVEWQKQYRQNMDKLANQFQIAAESIEKSRDSLENIAESSNKIAVGSKSIVDCTEKLDPILHTLNEQLDAFSALRQRALGAFPLIEDRLGELTTGFSSAVQTAIRESCENVEAQREILLEQSILLESITKSTTENINQLATNFSKSVDTSIKQAHDSMNQQQEALTERFSELEGTTAETSQQLQKTIDGIGSQLDDVFEKSTSHISQLTTGFAQNLTQQLENTLNKITTDFLDGVETTITDSQASMEKQRTALSAHSSTLQTTINDVSEQIGGILKNVSDTVNESQSSMDQQRQELSRLTQQLQSNFSTLERTLEAVLTESLNSLASKHGESLQNLGANLAALSEKFVADYTPLTEELHRLVRTAENNQTNNERDIEF